MTKKKKRMTRQEEDDLIAKVLGDLDIAMIPTQPLFRVNGVTFEVVAKIRAVRDDGKMIEQVINPIMLAKTPDLYDAMLTLSIACEVPEFQIEPNELLKAAQEIATEINDGKFKWANPKKGGK